VYEQNSFEPVARVVQLSEVLEKQRIAEKILYIQQHVPSGVINQDFYDRIEQAKTPLLKIYHYHCNHLGTPQELTNQDGDVIWLSYDRAWGGSFETIYKPQFIDNFAISESELQPIKFQGQSLDTETGLHYNRFRYYDSDVGMFISRDPIELLGGFNVFAYAPNPVMWIDPWGLNPCNSASGKLPELRGKTVAYVEKLLAKAGFKKTKVSNSPAKNQTWNHADGSEVRVHPYGNEKVLMKNGQPTPKSGLNAHVHKENPAGHQLDDKGNISTNLDETHIGIKNPSDLPIIRQRPHGSGI